MKIKKPLLLLVPGIIIIAAFAIFFTISQANKSQKDAASTVKEHNASAENTPLPSDSPNGTSLSKPESTITSISANYTNKWGNTPGNILNGGYFASSGDYLYFDSPFPDKTLFPGLIRSMKDGITGIVKLPTEKAKSINVSGEWIYFVDSNDNLCKIKINGKDYTKIENRIVTSPIVYDNSIYYIYNNSLMKRSLNDNSPAVLLKESVSAFILSENGQSIIYIASIYTKDSFYLHKMSISNTNDDKSFLIPAKNFSGAFFSYKNYIFLSYFSSQSQNSSSIGAPTMKVYRLDTSSNNDKLEEYIDRIDGSLSISMNDKYMYCTSLAGNKLEIVKIDVENKAKQSFIPTLQANEVLLFSGILDDTAYYWSLTNNNVELWLYDMTAKTLKKNILSYGVKN